MWGQRGFEEGLECQQKKVQSNIACKQLDTAVKLAELRGEVASINEFWDFVFSVRSPRD
jgi:hypothetical protein